MKKSLIVFGLLLGSVGIGVAQYSGGFSDVSEDQWFYPFIMEIKNWGVVDGNDDGTFAPERSINRAEFSKMLVRYDDIVDEKIAAEAANLRLDLMAASVETEETTVEEVEEVIEENVTPALPSVMYLTTDENRQPADCPVDWTEVSYGRIYEDEDNQNQRVCMTDRACQVMTLRSRDNNPTECPALWEEANFADLNSKDRARVCYLCVN